MPIRLKKKQQMMRLHGRGGKGKHAAPASGAAISLSSNLAGAPARDDAPFWGLGAALTGSLAIGAKPANCRRPRLPARGCALVAIDRRRRGRSALWQAPPTPEGRRQSGATSRGWNRWGRKSSVQLFNRCRTCTASSLPMACFSNDNHAGRPDIDSGSASIDDPMAWSSVPLVLTMKDIVRFPSTSRIHFHRMPGQCAAWNGAGRAGQTRCSFNHGMISLRGMDRREAIDPARRGRSQEGKRSGRWVEGRRRAPHMKPQPARLDKMSRTIASWSTAQNWRGNCGPEQGYPLRLVVPGLGRPTSTSSGCDGSSSATGPGFFP